MMGSGWDGILIELRIPNAAPVLQLQFARAVCISRNFLLQGITDITAP